MEKENFYEIIEQIDDCLTIYENKYYDYTKFYLELANGEQIAIKFDENNIPHLLGINIDELRSSRLFTGNAYEILDEITKSPFKLYNQIQKGYIKSYNVFSEHIDKKLDNFKNICGINIFDIEFIVKYEKDKNLRTDSPLYDGYYIGYINNSKLNVVGFEKNEVSNTYYPHTSLLFEEYSNETDVFLKRLINNQTVTVVEKLRKNTINENGEIDKKLYYYSNYDKLSKLRSCKRYAETYNGTASTIYSNIFFVDKVINLNDEKKTITEALIEIAEKIKDKKVIDINTLKAKHEYSDKAITEIVSAHNDSLVNSNNNNAEEYSYKELIKKYEEAKKEAIKLDDLTKKLEEKNQTLTEELAIIKQEKKELIEEREQIKNILIKK